MLRGLKQLTKAAIRTAVRSRLCFLPLSPSTAEWYADQIKRWPAVLGDIGFQTRRKLPVGVEMDLGILDVIERTLLTTGVWDPVVEKTISAYLKPGDVFLDVGANIGYFSMLASKLVGDTGRVVSFEPSVRALAKLAPHLMLNECHNVTICHQAMGAATGTATLTLAPVSNIGGSTISRGRCIARRVEQIYVRRIDQVCEELEIVPSLIKLDVEGFELFALQGAERILREHHPVVVCELTNQFLRDHGQAASDVLSYMLKLGYDA